MKSKAFFIIFKGLTLKQIKQTFLEGKSPTLRPKPCPNHSYSIKSPLRSLTYIKNSQK